MPSSAPPSAAARPPPPPPPPARPAARPSLTTQSLPRLPCVPPPPHLPTGFAASQLFNQGVSYTYDDAIFLPGHICFGAHEVRG